MRSADSVSWPSGFSNTTRDRGVTTAALARFRHITENRFDAVEKKNTRMMSSRPFSKVVNAA
jgi:hypothetical protein